MIAYLHKRNDSLILTCPYSFSALRGWLLRSESVVPFFGIAPAWLYERAGSSCNKCRPKMRLCTNGHVAQKGIIHTCIAYHYRNKVFANNGHHGALDGVLEWVDFAISKNISRMFFFSPLADLNCFGANHLALIRQSYLYNKTL